MADYKYNENDELNENVKITPLDNMKPKIKKIIPFSKTVEKNEMPEVLHNTNGEKQRVYSRKREASSSLSEDLKRYNDKMLLTPELIKNDVFSQSSSKAMTSKYSHNCRINNSDVNMNNYWPDRNVLGSLHQDVDLLQSMEIDFQLGNKSDNCAESSLSASSSDLSVHSASTSVGIQEDLDCLHLTDEIPVRDAVSNNNNDDMFASPLVPSLFPKVPPTIYFSTMGERVQRFPHEIRKLLKWKTSTITPALIRESVEKSGFKIVKDGAWLGVWGKHMKCATYCSIGDFQKVNHFPGSFHLGRKDKMWQNYNKMRVKHGSEFSFFPETYILPQDLRVLRKVWENDGPKRRWIIKPPASARGTGIKVINKWNQIPKSRPIVVQRYLSEPYLINDSKFDLRLYVLVPSYDPLRIYIFEDGLVRFASVKYSTSARSLSDPYMHLTNYSINRNSSTYTANEDENTCQGHKWTLKSLQEYLEERGINFSKIWETILDLVIKTIVCSESPMTHLIKNFTKSRYNCYELFGFDIMLDKHIKPWLIEVNISPSLHISSSLDYNVKSQVVKDMLNIVGYKIPSSASADISSESLLPENGLSLEETENLCMNKTLHNWYLSPDEKAKHALYTQKPTEVDEVILATLSPDDVRYLIECEDELSRSGSFIRIFPSDTSSKYLQFFERPRYYNLLLDAWERKYAADRNTGIAILQDLCQKSYHLQTLFKEQPDTVQDDGHIDL